MKQSFRLVVVFFLVVFLQGRAGTPIPSQVNSLWIAGSAEALKIASGDGSVILKIPGLQNVRALAIDSQSSTVWLYAGHELLAYDFEGTKRFTAPVSLPDPVWADLAVHPGDGSVWLAAGKELQSFSASGEALVSLRLSQDVRSLAVGPDSSLLWVGRRDAAAALDAVTGDPVLEIPVQRGSALQDLWSRRRSHSPSRLTEP